MCKLDDDSYRVYYEFAPTANIGLRATHVLMNDLRLTKETDEIFNRPSVSSIIHDLSVAVSYPLGERVALLGRFGLAYWEEHRTLVSPFGGETSDGMSPVIGFGVDFGGRRLRAGLFADLYPSVGDTDYVACYGVGVRFVFGAPSQSE